MRYLAFAQDVMNVRNWFQVLSLKELNRISCVCTGCQELVSSKSSAQKNLKGMQSDSFIHKPDIIINYSFCLGVSTQTVPCDEGCRTFPFKRDSLPSDMFHNGMLKEDDQER
jgi:hypothetical protein